MSIFRIKDIDYKFTEFLDNKTLFSLKVVNKYYVKIFDDKFWKRRFFYFYKKYIKLDDKYINIYKQNWIKYYKLTSYLYNFKNLAISLYDSIIMDSPDLFYLLINYNKLKTNKLFNSGKYKDIEAYNYTSKNNLRFLPINLIIEKDSVNCFKFLIKEQNKKLYEYYFENSIRNKSHNIINYMIEKNIIKINVRFLKLILLHRCYIQNLFIHRFI